MESKAVRSTTQPLAGFWKQDCKHEFGVAIGLASDKLYFLSYCTPRGCFEEGTWRPHSPIDGDPAFRVVDEDHIEFVGKELTFVRCAGRVSGG